MTDSAEQLEALRRDTLREFVEAVLTTDSIPVLDAEVNVGDIVSTEGVADSNVSIDGDAQNTEKTTAERVEDECIVDTAFIVSEAVSERSVDADDECLGNVIVLKEKLEDNRSD